MNEQQEPEQKSENSQPIILQIDGAELARAILPKLTERLKQKEGEADDHKTGDS